MSMSIADGKGTLIEVSSNQGWGDFSRFVERLEGVPQLAHLVAYGWCQEPEDAVEELKEAASLMDDPDISSVAEQVLEALEQVDGAAVITDGLGPTEEHKRLKHVGKTATGGEHWKIVRGK